MSAKIKKAVFFSVAFALIGCVSNKMSIGIWSSFRMEDHHRWVQVIPEDYVEIFQSCCYSEGQPHFLHRVVEDDRGWVFLIGAGEGVTKSDIIADKETTAESPIMLKNLRIDHVSWEKNDRLLIHRFMYDEPRSGLLISFDFLLDDRVNREEALEAIEADLNQLLRVKGV